MRRTRLSLFYLAGYLVPTGLLWLVAPRATFRLMLSNVDYGSDVFPRVAGLLLLGIGFIVIQIIRHRLEVLYPTTLIVRSAFLIGFTGFYFYTRDPLFLVVLGVLGFGFVLTGTCYWLDAREKGGG